MSLHQKWWKDTNKRRIRVYSTIYFKLWVFLHLLNGPQKRQTWRNAHFGKKWVIFPISKLQFSEEPTLEAHRKRCHNTFPVERKRTHGLSTIPEDLTFPPNRSLIVNSLLRTCPIRTTFFSGSKNPHCGKKVWSKPDSDLAYFGGSRNPHGGKENMVRTRLHLSLFWWIEKSTRWKKKVWAEPDFNLAALGGSKNPHGGKKSMVRTRLRLSLFWWIEKSTRWKKKYGPNQTSTQPAILVDRKIHTVEKDRRFKEHFGQITKRKFSCLPP